MAYHQLPVNWRGTHTTSGDLAYGDWPTDSAIDIMLAPNTMLGAPEAGTVKRWGSAQGGEALYFLSDSGIMYWLGHVYRRAAVGKWFRKGAVIAYVSPDHPRPHVHLDKKELRPVSNLVLDLSNNNHNPNFVFLRRAGIEGVMLKVSEGTSFTDPVFVDWSRRARKAGLRVGGYHFAQPDGNDPIAEARHFASKLGKVQRRDFRPALDLERNPGGLNGDQLEAWSRKFNQEVVRLTGHGPLFYASTAWIKKMNFNVPIGFGLWLAHWSNDGRPFDVPPPHPWKKVHMHQFTSEALGTSPLHPNGISGRVDINRINFKKAVLAHPVLGWL